MSKQDKLEYYARFFNLSKIDEDRRMREQLRGKITNTKVGKSFVEKIKEMLENEIEPTEKVTSEPDMTESKPASSPIEETKESIRDDE